MELTGTIKKILDEKAISASFRKRELVLATDDRYPQEICVEFTQDKITLIDGLSVLNFQFIPGSPPPPPPGPTSCGDDPTVDALLCLGVSCP